MRPTPPERLQILIAEDDGKTAEAVARGLPVEGFSSRRAEDGVNALKQILQSDFDAVVLDVPRTEGMEVIQASKTEEVSRQTAVTGACKCPKTGSNLFSR